MRFKYCPTTGKVAYKNAADAKKQLAFMNRIFHGCEQDLVEHLRSPYRCYHCNRWHLTRLTHDESAALTARLAPYRAKA